MVLSFVLAAAVAASPRPLPGADSGIYIPRLDRTSGVLAFMERAGERSVLLRPSTWFADFHPLLYVDFTKPESLKAAGISAEGSATVSFRKDGRMTCVELADAKAFAARARERLATFGTLWEGRLGGAPVIAAKSETGGFVAGYAQRGNVACSVYSSKDAQELLKAAGAAVRGQKPGGAWRQLGGISGQVFLVSGGGAAGLDGDKDALRVDARASGLMVAPLDKAGPSPYAQLNPVGLMVARANIKPSEIPNAVQSLTSFVPRVCPKCDKAAVAALSQAVGAQLTGKMAVSIDSLAVKGRLRTDAQRFFAARQVWLGEVKDPKKVAAALAALEKWEGARKVETGWALPVEGGEVLVGTAGAHVYLANDAQALKVTLAALPEQPGKLDHAMTFAVDPQKTSRALARISLFDVLGSKELAGLFAISTELGPLLTMTEAVTGFVDPDKKGAHRVGVRWTLKPQSP